jgi:bifunctional non-homologous end joining protein LigD
MELGSRAALQGAAQMNVLEFHPWNARNLHIDKPDRMVFDLDPGEGVPWRALQEGAVLIHALLDELGLQSWLKTSGGKGLHLVVPLAARWRFDVVKGFARAVVQHLASTAPERFVAKSGPANRRGRIFVDYLRNGEGATTVAAWSPRARPGLGVSMPLVWEELDQVKGAAQWTVSDAVSRLEGPHVDAWQAMAVTRQSLREPMKALGFRPDADGD